MNQQALRLYKQILRAGKQFKDYNFREYVLRRAKEDFQELQKNPEIFDRVIQKYTNELEVVKRQVIVQNLYFTENHVIEQKQCAN